MATNIPQRETGLWSFIRTMTTKLCCCIPFLCKDEPEPYLTGVPGYEEAPSSSFPSDTTNSDKEKDGAELDSAGARGCHEAPSSSSSNDTTKSHIVGDEGKAAIDMDKLDSAGTHKDPSSSSSSQATESDILNTISRKDITEVDGKDMVDLGELVKDISKLLDLRMRKKEERVHKKKWTGKKWICPGGSDLSNLQEILSSGIETLSDLKDYISGPLKTLLKKIGSASVVTAGLLVLAYTLERFDDISTNKEKCWNLLKEMGYVATVLQRLKDSSIEMRDNSKETRNDLIVDATSLIAEGAIMCCAQIASSGLNSFLSASKNKDDLNDIREKLTAMYHQINMEIGLRASTDIERILGAIEKINQKAPLSRRYPTHAVGIDTPVKEVLELLECDSEEKAVTVILHGFGGMGKTTLAQAVFSQVQGCRFSKVELFKDINSKADIEMSQKQILKDLMGPNKPITDIRSYQDGQQELEVLLSKVEAFIYIDNVLDREALKKLLPQDMTTAMKVRFLLTARDEDVKTACPRSHTSPKIYSMKGTQQPEAMLILKKEIGEKLNDSQFNDIIQICGQIPLMLTLAAPFIGRADDIQEAYSTLKVEKDKWESEILKEGFKDMDMCCSFAYNALSDKCKDSFLDICSYFKGWDWDRVEDIVGKDQLKMLASRALVTRTTNGVANIHDVILTLARQKSKEESKGKEVRLTFTSASKLKEFLEKEDPKGIKGIWSTDDDNVSEISANTLDLMHESLRVLKLGKRTKVESKCSKIFKELVLFQAQISPLPFDVSKSEQFRYLHCNPNDLKLSQMPSSLRYLSLDDSSRSHPFQIYSTDLGQLQYLRRLSLVNFPELKNLPKELGDKIGGLQELFLSGCKSIEKLPDSISKLRSLRILGMNGCSSLTELPVNFESLTSLQTLHLSGCSKLKALPDGVEKLSSLTLLNLSSCESLLNLPPDIGNLTHLVKLNLAGCVLLETIPESIGALELEVLDVSNCRTLKELPHGFCNFSFIRHILFQNCYSLEKLPDRFGQLTSLKILDFFGCQKLEKLPEGFGQLKNLEVLSLEQCRCLRELCNDFHCLSSLQNLDLSWCCNLERLPEDFHCLSSLQHLYLSYCFILEGKSMDHVVKMNSIQVVHIEESKQLITKWAEISRDGDESWSVTVFTGQDLSMRESQKEDIEKNVLSQLDRLLTNGRREPCHLSDLPADTLILLIRDVYAYKNAFPWPLIEEAIDEMQINFKIIYIGDYFDYLNTKVQDRIFVVDMLYSRANEMLEKVCLTLDAAVPHEKHRWYLQIDRNIAGDGQSDKYRPCWKFLSSGELEEFVAGNCRRYVRLKELAETNQASNTELLRELFAAHVFGKNESSEQNSELKTTTCGVDRFKGKTILLEMRRPADLRYDYRLRSLKEMYAVVEKEQLDLEIISIPILGPNDDVFQVHQQFLREVPWFVLQNSWTVIRSVTKFFLAKQCRWEEGNGCEKWYPTVNWIIEPNGGITIYRPSISLKDRGEVFKDLFNYIESESYQVGWGVNASLATSEKIEELKKREWEQLKDMSALEFLFNHLESISTQVKKLMFQGKLICLYSGHDEDAICSIRNAMVQFRESIHIIHIKYKLARFDISDTIFKKYYDYSSENTTEMEVMSGLNLSMQETARFSMRLHHLEEEINGMDKSEQQVCELKNLLHYVQIRDEDRRYGSITFMDERGKVFAAFRGETVWWIFMSGKDRAQRIIKSMMKDSKGGKEEHDEDPGVSDSVINNLETTSAAAVEQQNLDVYFDSLREYISELWEVEFYQLSQFNEEGKKWSQPKVTWPTSKGFCRLKNLLSEGNDDDWVRDVISRHPDENKLKSVIKSVLKGIEEANWAVAGLLAVAHVLERFETVSTSRERLLFHLDDVFMLAQYTQQFNEKAGLWRGMKRVVTTLIVACSLECCVLIDESKFALFDFGIDRNHLVKKCEIMANAISEGLGNESEALLDEMWEGFSFLLHSEDEGGPSSEDENDVSSAQAGSTTMTIEEE